MLTNQLFAYSIPVTGSEMRSCEQISLFHHHQSSGPITMSQQAFGKTLKSPFFPEALHPWLDEKEGGEDTEGGSGEVKLTDKCLKKCSLGFNYLDVLVYLFVLYSTQKKYTKHQNPSESARAQHQFVLCGDFKRFMLKGIQLTLISKVGF